MKIRSVEIPDPEGQSSDSSAQMIKIEISGPFDSNNAVLKRARELVGKTGSATMMESFDWAVQNDAIAKDK